MDAFGNELNRLLVETYRIAGKIEQIMLEDLSDGRLSLAEMRAIESVGGGRPNGRTVTEISQDLDITLPSVTAMVKRLETKGYVTKQRSDSDARQVRIRLTDRGFQAFVGYRFAQRKMINAVRESISADECPMLMHALQGLNEFFRQKIEELEGPLSKDKEE